MLKNKHICSLLAALSCGFIAYAQTAHDNPCGAIVLPVVESADPPAENRVSFNGATYTAFSINGLNTCSGYFTFPADPDVWYRFVATHTQLRVAISPAQGGNPGCNVFYGVSSAEFLVLTGNCSGPFTQVACGRSDIASSTLLSNLTVGTTYYIKISSGFGYTCGTLSCAVYTGFPPSTARMGINTSLPQSNLDVAGNAFFRNRVGIGVNNPLADLHVAGSMRLNNGTEGNGKVLSSNADGLATWQNATWVTNGNHISNANSGNVGIGTPTPVSYGDAGKALQIESSGNGYNLGSSLVLSYNSLGANYGSIGSINFVQSNATSAEKKISVIRSSLETIPIYGSLEAPLGRLDFFVNDGGALINALTVSSKGNVGIGNNIPRAPLQFANDTRNRKIVLWSDQNNDHQFYGFGVNGGLLRYQTNTTSDDHVFYAGLSATTSRELLRIKGNGLVGIGANDPQYRLDVDNRIRVRSGGDNNNSAGIWLNRTDNSSLQSFVGINQNNVGFYGVPFGWGLEMNTTTGNVGIGNSSPQVPLHFAASLGKKISLFRGASGDAGFGVHPNELRIHSDYNGADITFGFDNLTTGFTERFRVRANGNATLSGVLTQNSDATLKKNIEPIHNASDLLMLLQGYRYQWKDENADTDIQLGLLAQEVQKVLPELVKANEQGNLGVNYSGLIPVLLEALKEQQARIAELEKKINKIISK